MQVLKLQCLIESEAKTVIKKQRLLVIIGVSCREKEMIFTGRGKLFTEEREGKSG